MNAVWILLVLNCFWLTFANDENADGNRIESDEENEFKLEFSSPNPIHPHQTRRPKTFIKKLHSSAAFLTGLKLGAILSKKGFELGHGKIASTHSFQIFGKPVNSAMSLSYGSVSSLLPVVDDIPEAEGSDSSKRANLKKDEKKVFRVTVIESPSNETIEKLQALPSRTDGENANGVGQNASDERINENIVMLYQDSLNRQPEDDIKSDFLEKHNKRVKEFNESIMKRRNSKF